MSFLCLQADLFVVQKLTSVLSKKKSLKEENLWAGVIRVFSAQCRLHHAVNVCTQGTDTTGAVTAEYLDACSDALLVFAGHQVGLIEQDDVRKGNLLHRLQAHMLSQCLLHQMQNVFELL